MRDLLNDLESGSHLSDPDPVKRARNNMKTPQLKRFYTNVETVPLAEGFAVHLDGKPVRTPAKALLSLPVEAAARLVADEFAGQSETIDPMSMPVTRLVNTAIDGVASDPQAVLEDILRFASSDLLYYRADAPEGLVARQNQAWDPVIEAMECRLGVHFRLAEGVMHVEQPRETIAAIGLYLRQRSQPLQLAALHVKTSITGSALLALAVDAGEIEAEAAWISAHIDEDWNIEHWGDDSEAVARRNARKRDFLAAFAIIRALSPTA